MSWKDSEHWQRENSARLRLAANDWTPKAACRGGNTEVFFPERGDSELAAKQVCGLCVVKIECLTYALEAAEKTGVWGQASERQRRPLRRAIRIETEQGIDRYEATRNAVKRFFKPNPRPNLEPNNPQTVTDAVLLSSENESAAEANCPYPERPRNEYSVRSRNESDENAEPKSQAHTNTKTPMASAEHEPINRRVFDPANTR